ncbi:MAG: hypothetical protein PVJ67_00900 [Candidatus Pacearchaeota archaeon]|jgi:hypothetical protein
MICEFGKVNYNRKIIPIIKEADSLLEEMIEKVDSVDCKTRIMQYKERIESLIDRMNENGIGETVTNAYESRLNEYLKEMRN